MTSRNKREGVYTGKFAGEHDRQRDKKNRRLLGWAYVDKCVWEEYKEFMLKYMCKGNP
jgi:hypothetical protein